MRDPERIPRILEKLRILWAEMPDLRLGQLVDNARMVSDGHDIDLFYIEDDLIEEGLERISENHENKYC
jgi:hypothetical protein